VSKPIRLSDLSPARQALVRLCQTINFGNIEDLKVERAEPVFDPPPLVLQDVKLDFGTASGTRLGGFRRGGGDCSSDATPQRNAGRSPSARGSSRGHSAAYHDRVSIGCRSSRSSEVLKNRARFCVASLSHCDEINFSCQESSRLRPRTCSRRSQNEARSCVSWPSPYWAVLHEGFRSRLG
jgi:hypothetical protein